MSTTRKILSNTIVQFGGKILIAILSAVSIKFVSSYLGPDIYGKHTVIFDFLGFFAIAADLGLYTIAVREMSKDMPRIEYILGNILSLRTILTFSVLVLANIVIWILPMFSANYDSDLIKLGTLIVSISTFLNLLNGTITTVLQVHLKMQYAAFAEVLGKILSVGFILLTIFYLQPEDPITGFYYITWAAAISAITMLIITITVTSRIAKISYRFDLDFWWQALKESAPYGLALFLNRVYFKIDSQMITFFRGSFENGLYAIPSRILDILMYLPLFFMNAVLPTLTRHIKDKTERVKEIIQYSYDFLIIFAIPIVFGAIILAYPLIYIISSEEYLSKLDQGIFGSDIALQILIFFTLFAFITSLFNFVLIALNKQMKLLWVNGFAALANIAGNIFLIPEYGFRGAAIMSVISEFIALAVSYHLCKKYLKFKLSPRTTIISLICASIMGVSIYYLQTPLGENFGTYSIALLIPVGAAIYGIFMLIFKGVDPKIFKLLKKS